jgi:hypothetical protein
MEFASLKKVKFLAAILLIPLLTSCGSTAPKKVTPAASVEMPTSCESAPVFEEIKNEIPGSQFINTHWEPTPNTELFDVLNNGGLACTYGLQSAEIGVTVRWVKDLGFYNKWSKEWLKSGYQLVDLAEYGMKQGYLSAKPQSATQEFNLWNLNFLQNGVWVSLSKTTPGDLSSARDLIKSLLSK